MSPTRGLMRWMEDPKLARKLARATWLVLVGTYVVLTRWPLEAPSNHVAVAGLLTLVTFMNVPIVIGLKLSWADRETAAYRAVALALLMRVVATGFVVWSLGFSMGR